jgi:hypothetical protein
VTDQDLPTPSTLLADLRRVGVILTARGDRLSFDAPAGALTPDLRATLIRHKPELLAALKAQAAPRLLSVEAGIEWEQQHIRRARAMIQRATRDPERADELYGTFSGAWSIALCEAGASEEGAVNYALSVLAAAIAAQPDDDLFPRERGPSPRVK